MYFDYNLQRIIFLQKLWQMNLLTLHSTLKVLRILPAQDSGEGKFQASRRVVLSIISGFLALRSKAQQRALRHVKFHLTKF